MKIVCIIPARADSKRLPLKNIKKLKGKSLIQYTIDSAKRSSLIDKILVSTNNERIATIAKKAGAEVPFLRPKKISGDSSAPIDTIKHAVNYLVSNAYLPDIIVYLQPTSPFRSTSLIDDSIKLLKKSKATSVVSVSKVKMHPYTSFWLKKNFLQPLKKDFHKFSLTQKKPKIYHPTGAIYTFWRKNLKKYNSFYGPKIKPLIVNEEELNVDIDTNYDMFIAEMTIRYWKNFQKNIK